MPKLPLPLLLLLLTLTARAQEEIGLNPPSVRWYKLQTPAGKVIFPEGLDSQAFRVGRIVNYERVHDSTVNERLCKPVPIILQNRSTLPAGFATPAPWRLENYLTPPQNNFLGTARWLDALTIHEYRHAQQFWAANQGFTRIYQVLMGQTGWILNALLTQPLWYREGDAVLAETIFTTGGRGREPEFMNRYRALRQSGLHFNYEKAVSGSLRDYVPHIYHSGYMMVSYGRQRFGADIWQEVVHDAHTRKGFLWPFSRSLKSHTGLRTPQLYRQTMQYVDSIYAAQEDTLQLIPARLITEAEPHHYINYRYPHYHNDSLLLVQKSSFDQINTFYLVHPDGHEEKLFHPGIYTSDHEIMNYRNGRMAWAETRYDERWRAQDYSVVMCYDFASGRKWQVKKRTRWFGPALAPDGSRLVVVEYTLEGQTRLLIVDPQTGAEISALPNPDSYYFSHPCWSEDMQTIYAVALGDEGNTLVAINATTGEMKQLLPFSKDPIKHPAAGQKLYFSAGWTSIQNIYGLDLKNGQLFQITGSRFGADQPSISPDGKKLLYTEYTAGGFQLREMTLSQAMWRSFHLDLYAVPQPFEVSNLEQEGQVIAEQAPKDTFAVSRYRPFFSSFFNLYGWFPLPNVPEYGAEFYLRDIMSRHQGTLGLLYNTNEDRFRSYGRYTYAGLYPLINLEAEAAGRRSEHIGYLRNGEQRTYSQTWHENVFSAGLSLPLNFSRGTYQTWITPRADYQFITYSPDTFFHLADGELHGIQAALELQHTQIKAARQLNPRWGQTLNLTWNHGLSESDPAPQKIQAEGTLYLPGIKRSHSLYFQGGYKTEESLLTYRYHNDFVYARGYKELLPDVWKATANYALPLFYPDWSLGSVAFFQRFHLNLFYDYSQGTDVTGHIVLQRSAGAELIASLTLFRLFLIQIGPQYAWKFDEPDAGKRGYFNVVVPRFVF